MNKTTHSFKVGDIVRFKWNGITRSGGDYKEYRVAPGNVAVCTKDSSVVRMLEGYGHVFSLVKRSSKTTDRNYKKKGPNLTSWGNSNYAIPLWKQKWVADEANKNGYCNVREKGKTHRLPPSTVWRVQQVYRNVSDEPYQDHGDYTDEFRLRACKLAVELGARKVANTMGCHISSIYNWLKVYNMANAYFNREA